MDIDISGTETPLLSRILIGGQANAVIKDSNNAVSIYGGYMGGPPPFGAYSLSMGELIADDGTGKNSINIGYGNSAGINSAVFGMWCGAYGQCSFAAGGGAYARGQCSFAFGSSAYAYGNNTYAIGVGVQTTESGAEGQFVCGKYNLLDENYLFVVGNGSYEKRKNAFAITTDGTAYCMPNEEGILNIEVLSDVDTDISNTTLSIGVYSGNSEDARVFKKNLLIEGTKNGNSIKIYGADTNIDIECRSIKIGTAYLSESEVNKLLALIK